LSTENKESAEQVLGLRIVSLHDDSGLGFRKIAQKLIEEGCRTNKDSVNRIYHKFRKENNVQAEKRGEVEELRLQEARLRGKVDECREKEALRKRLTLLFVQKQTVNYEARKKLFLDRDFLLRFSKRVWPVLQPVLWDELVELCETKGYALSSALAICLGKQADFEQQMGFDSGGDQGFETYFQNRIISCLRQWKERDQPQTEESGNTQETQENSELLWIEFP
jgi:hypothetical protein